MELIRLCKLSCKGLGQGQGDVGPQLAVLLCVSLSSWGVDSIT